MNKIVVAFSVLALSLAISGSAFAGWNELASYGAYIGAASAVWFVITVIYTLTSGKKVAANPWGEGATTLEWTLPSPPAFHSYEELPVIKASGHH